jgi:hypothetical protein
MIETRFVHLIDEYDIMTQTWPCSERNNYDIRDAGSVFNLFFHDRSQTRLQRYPHHHTLFNLDLLVGRGNKLGQVIAEATCCDSLRS